jgi:hypothetical protein
MKDSVSVSYFESSPAAAVLLDSRCQTVGCACLQTARWLHRFPRTVQTSPVCSLTSKMSLLAACVQPVLAAFSDAKQTEVENDHQALLP